MQIWNGKWKQILAWNGIWKKILVWNGIRNGRFLVWNGRKLPEWNMKKSSSIPYHALLGALDVKKKTIDADKSTRGGVLENTF